MDFDLRALVLRRDALTCKICGKKPAAQVHHLLRRGQKGRNDPGNLAVLCGRCHMLISPVPVWVLCRVWKLTPVQVAQERRRLLPLERGLLLRRPRHDPLPASPLEGEGQGEPSLADTCVNASVN